MAAWPPSFRRLLPIAQTVSAACFGGIGLWQRASYLNSSWLGWNSTERYHVWPWPFKFAVVTNLPAFLVWAVVGWPIGERWPDISEGAMAAPALLFVAILWYGVGAWMDKQWERISRPASKVGRPWMLLAAFTALSATAASVYIRFPTSEYLEMGAVLWLAVGLGVATVTVFRNVRARHR